MRIRRTTIWATLVVVGAVTAACARQAPVAVAAAPPAPGTPAAPAAPPFEMKASEMWFGAFLSGQRIGHLHIVIEPLERDGLPRVEIRANDDVTLDVLGQKLQQKVTMVTLCEPDLRPLEQTITIASGGRETLIVARYGTEQIECEVTGGQGTRKQTVPIPPGARIVGDVRAVLADGQLNVGESVELYEFNPITLTVDKNVVTGLREETIEVGGEKVKALVTRTDNPLMPILSWLDADGLLLQMEAEIMAAKLVYRRETQEQVLASTGEAGKIDLLTASAIRPDRPIANPRELTRLVLRAKGLDKLKRVPSGDYQQAEKLEEGWWKITIAPPPVSDAPGATLPIQDEALAEFLKPAAYIESDDPRMTAKAKEILGADPPQGSLAVARKIHGWVSRHIQWQANIGLLRSALEILNDPAGVCRDAAALYTALCRAAGVPTRVCAGLLYVDGAFAGHAWAECWDGQRWVPFDPTRPTTFVDATHLKLADGAAYTCMFDMMPALGGMEIQVVEPAAN